MKLLLWHKIRYRKEAVVPVTRNSNYLRPLLGEGNGTPLQYSCLENSMDGEPGRLQSMGSLRDGHNWATSFSLLLSCIGEGNGNPLQCSFLENPRDGGAWWAAVYGVAQSQTRLKWLSSTLHTLDVQSEFVLPNWNYTWTNTSPFPPPSSPWQLSFHIPFLGVWLF